MGIVVIAPKGVHDDVEGRSEEASDIGGVGGIAEGGEGHDNECSGVSTVKSGAREKRAGWGPGEVETWGCKRGWRWRWRKRWGERSGGVGNEGPGVD